jgi:hypothetical protein
VSPSPILPLCRPHLSSHCVSLTNPPTVSPSPILPLCRPHQSPHCVSLTNPPTGSPSPILPLRPLPSVSRDLLVANRTIWVWARGRQRMARERCTTPTRSRRTCMQPSARATTVASHPNPYSSDFAPNKSLSRRLPPVVPVAIRIPTEACGAG